MHAQAVEWAAGFALSENQTIALSRIAHDVITGEVDGDLRVLEGLLKAKMFHAAKAEFLQYSCKNGMVVALHKRLHDQQLF